MTTHHTRIRQLLRDSQDGLTASEIVDATGVDAHAIRKALRTMIDSYIDRWRENFNHQYVAVWCVVTPPEDCPKPNRARNGNEKLD